MSVAQPRFGRLTTGRVVETFTVARQLLAVRRAPRDLERWVCPGTWRHHGSRALVHADVTALPSSLVGEFVPGRGERVLAAFAPPRRVSSTGRRPGEDGGHGVAVTVLLYQGPGRVVAFDPDSGHVVQRYPQPIPAWYAPLRRRYARHQRTPEFAVLNRHVLRERLVDGRPFRDLAPDEQLVAAEVLLRRQQDLLDAEGRGDAATCVRSGIEDLHAMTLPDEAHHFLRGSASRLTEIASSWPLVPSPRGVSDRDVLVDGDGPTIIDLEPNRLAWVPPLYDIATLAFSASRGLAPGALLRALTDPDSRLVLPGAAAGATRLDGSVHDHLEACLVVKYAMWLTELRRPPERVGRAMVAALRQLGHTRR